MMRLIKPRENYQINNLERPKTKLAHMRGFFWVLYAAAADLESFVFIPYDLEPTKVLGTMIYGTNLIAN